MKYIKLILAVAITASVAGFVAWHLMWMTGIERKFKAEQSSGAGDKIEVKERNSEDQKGKTEKNRPAGEEGAMSVKESRSQVSQTGTSRQETEKQGAGKSEAGTKPSVEEKNPALVEEEKLVNEEEKWFEKDTGLGKKQQGVKPGPVKTTTEILNDKTVSVTSKSRVDPAMKKNIPQPAQRPEVKVSDVKPYPTSSAP
ncbi:MAG: hypothetical protein HZC49_01170 [Nitrospirae bacterium]|nr:hypothetical protein [Nitrospirota bacterium]